MKYCKGKCATPDPWWKFCPVCGYQIDPKAIKKMIDEVEKESEKRFRYDALCHDCGTYLFPNYDPGKMTGITVSAGICPRCNKEATLVPGSDWRYASRLGGEWD